MKGMEEKRFVEKNFALKYSKSRPTFDALHVLFIIFGSFDCNMTRACPRTLLGVPLDIDLPSLLWTDIFFGSNSNEDVYSFKS